MSFFAIIRPLRFMVASGLLLVSAAGDTIHLKNGRSILADSVREANGRVEYTVGDNTFSLPKSSVASIDTGGTPIVTPAADIPSSASAPKLVIHDQEELAARLIVNGKVDTDVLNTLEREGDADKSASAYWLAAQHEESSGSYETAVRYIDRANALYPGNAIILTHYASVLLRLGRYKEAEGFAERASRLSPGMASAFSTLGFAQFQLSKTRACIVSWKRSLQLQPDPQIEDLLKKAERELAAEGSFEQEDSSHFSMRYEGGQAPAAFRRQILQTLELDFDDLSRNLDFIPRESITVVLYSNQQYFDVTQAPSWAGALYDGKLRMPINGLTSMTSSLAHSLKHELTHSFISAIAKGRCPTWLNEGVAQLEEGRSSRSNGSRLAALYLSQHNIPLNQLETSFTKFSTAEAGVAYAQSLLTAEYIRDTYGQSDLASVLKRLGEGQSAEAALRSTIHSGYGQLEQEITAFLRRSYGG